MYTSLPYLYLSLEKTGGLFDIDATLPVMTIQFFLLVQISSFLLFNPIQKILKQREQEIENNLKNARISLEEVEKLQQKIRRILQSVRERHLIRSREVEVKRQTAVIRSKKYITTATEARDLIPGVVQEINRYLRVRPPINRV
jgi:ElaB/YqjD/DUF883 family membrane-anchored ribosome-binding protein